MGLMIFMSIFIILGLFFLAVSLLEASSKEESKSAKIKRLRQELKTEQVSHAAIENTLNNKIAELNTENKALRLGLPMPSVSAYEAELATKVEEFKIDTAQRLAEIQQAYERNNTRGTKE